MTKPMPFDNDFRGPVPDTIHGSLKNALDRAVRCCEDAKAGRLPPPQQTPQIIPPQLWNRLRAEGWIDERGKWIELALERLSAR